MSASEDRAGLVEPPAGLEQSPLYNDDLAPTPLAKRTWNRWHLASLWVGMSVCIPTYMLAASHLQNGMDWLGAIGVILAGNVIVLIPMVLIGHAGTKYGIPLPVFLRASFGSGGAHIPSVMRALVACGWFGIQTWIGGKAIYEMLRVLWPAMEGPALPVLGINAAQTACFFAFWLANVWFIVKGTESIKWLETLAAPLLILIGLGLLGWGIAKGGGLGRILAHSENFRRPDVEAVREDGAVRVVICTVEIDGVPRRARVRVAAARKDWEAAALVEAPAEVALAVPADSTSVWIWRDAEHAKPREVGIVPRRAGGGLGVLAICAAVTAMVGYWSTLALNIPDFTRYARSQRDQWIGQAMGLPTTMTLYSFIGVAVTCAALVVFDDVVFASEAPWDPMALLGRFPTPPVVVLSMIFLAVATLTTNLAANVVAPANVFSNLAPRAVSFRAGGLITAVIGVAMMPWKLAEDPTGYIYTWLIGYSALLGPIAGILIADYFVVRRTRLDLRALYERTGVKPAAIPVLVLAILPNVPGFAAQLGLSGVPEIWKTLYNFAWFIGFAIAFLLWLGYGAWRRTGTS